MKSQRILKHPDHVWVIEYKTHLFSGWKVWGVWKDNKRVARCVGDVYYTLKEKYGYKFRINRYSLRLDAKKDAHQEAVRLSTDG